MGDLVKFMTEHDDDEMEELTITQENADQLAIFSSLIAHSEVSVNKAAPILGLMILGVSLLVNDLPLDDDTKTLMFPFIRDIVFFSTTWGYCIKEHELEIAGRQSTQGDGD
jgi:hypothetical protein